MELFSYRSILSLFAAMCAGVLLLCSIGCKASDPLETRRDQVVELAKKLVAEDSVHLIQTDARLARDPKADRQARIDASKRTDQHCKDFARLRSLIDVGRPLSDYAPIEKLGTFVGTKPNRFFVFGIGGFVRDQGPEPYLTEVELDSNNIIKKVGPVIMAD